jgi:hypothetical protein
MEQEYPAAKKLHPSLEVSWRFCLAVVALACLFPSLARAQNWGPNILPELNSGTVQPTYVPWAGVDDKGNIHGIDGKQFAVGDDGNINLTPFGPGVAVGDLTGHGKQDLVLADSFGFFWFFPNSGTPQKAAFTQGEVIPIWLGQDRTGWGTGGVNTFVPRIQLVDFANNKRLDIVAGTDTGALYHIPNVVAATQPNFQPTLHSDSLLINTHKNGVLWCNYLAPCLTNLFGSKTVLDLVMGEGTYSANSIYLLRNTGTTAAPSFNEDHLQKIIPGMGLEQLTPVVIDWNNDGKPDIICGDRTGYLNLFLNNSTDPKNPTFAPGTHIKVAGVEKLGDSITVALGDLTGNHLPNLLIGTADGTVLYALNTGTLGAPVFNTPATPLKGVLPPTYHYVSPQDWVKVEASGAPDELLAAVNPQLDPGFAFPEGENSKYALKFYVWPVTNTYFPVRYYPPVENYYSGHRVETAHSFTIKLNKTYRLHFWIKAATSIPDFTYELYAEYSIRMGFRGYHIINPANVGTKWTEVSQEFTINNPDDKTVTTWSYLLRLRFTGQPTLYIDDVQIQEKL